MTTITHPPTLTQNQGTPAHEWAKDAVGAVDGAAETGRQKTDASESAKGGTSSDAQGNLQGAASNVTTPGNELPGAFPRTASASEAPTTKGISESASSALGTVKQQTTPIAQSASQTASGVMASAEQAARQYLPTSLVGTLEGAGVLSGTNGGNPKVAKTSLPSQETGLEPTKSGGVGSLPGTASEASVAKLPEERELEREIGSPMGREGVLGTSADKSPTRHAGDVEKLTDDTAITGGPSTAGPHTAAQFLGSSLKPAPAAKHEGKELHRVRNVHETPGNTSATHASTTSPDNDAQAAERRGNTLAAPGGNTNRDASGGGPGGNTAYALDQEKRHAARPSPNHAYTPPGQEAGLAAENVDKGPSPLDTRREGEPASESGGAQTGGTGGSPTSGKPSLSQKIKGEAKIIAGKMSKDAKKVEAGKAMKGGHV